MKERNEILVSVVIPVKNGDYWLEDTLKGIFEQEIDGNLEIIIIDSGSTDKSPEIISRFPVRLIRIEPARFNHGGTRNLGVQHARGEFVVMTVQDARPADKFWLQQLLNGFDDENVAGVCGQQVVPHDVDKNPVEWFRPQSPPDITKYQVTLNEFEQLSPDDKRRVCGWDNVTAMYRKSVLLEIPFQEVEFAEDAKWAKDALLKGYSLVYNSFAKVYHYHFKEPNYLINRSFSVLYHLYKTFGYQPPFVRDGLKRLLSDGWILVREKKLTWKQKWKWYWYNYAVRKKTNEAIALFYKAVSQGEFEMENMYKKICLKIPQAVKPMKN